VWFNLGDRDLGLCLARARRLAAGESLTEIADDVRMALGVPATVLPMSDDPVRTWIKVRGRWGPFQEFMIRDRAAGPIADVEFRGAAGAAPTQEALAAIAGAEAVIVGPSNPVISIGPILALPGMHEALRGCPGPVVAVSPLVGGRSLKGPTEAFLAWAGKPLTSDGIAECYDGLLDGLVADQRASGMPTLETDVAMPDADGRRRLADATLRFALALAG
jgi:LPPG:FO 2-phospho-L-lactate transferase